MRLHSNILVSAYRMGLRVGDALAGRAADARESRDAAETADGDRSAIGDIGLVGIAPDAARPEDEPASGVIAISPLTAPKLEGVSTTWDNVAAEPVTAAEPEANLESGVVSVASAIEPEPTECEEPAPDSQVRSGIPVARISISRMSAVRESRPPGLRNVKIEIAVSPALLGSCAEAFLTLTTSDGKVVYEGTCDATNRLAVSVDVPVVEQEVRGLLDTGSKYWNARIKLADSGVTEHTFH